MSCFHLAEINIARARFPLESAEMAGFIDNLDRINALADRAEGFVWRLQDEAGNATAIQAFDDPRIIVNLSVWTSVEALRAFAYQTLHTRFVQRRAEWFAPTDGPHLALWWVPAGTLPTAAEGRDRLERLARHGPGPDAFTFARSYGAPTSLPAG